MLNVTSANATELNYMDQVYWTSMAKLYNDSSQSTDPIGLLSITHENFTEIIRTVIRREPNTTFR